MTTMSDEGERLCPLCTEEMDLTDQQLKPCKCGYEICVWCWHHIIDMAEKDNTEGRCPACRAPYDKERIVGTAANCERMMAEINIEKRQKPQKAKTKTPAETRKHLSSVRVIQRNLVYIIGLPSNLADESMLERTEYFGQYGKVLKVSISRPAGGAQQTSNNNTFSVYITYAKEEEAVRCIQAVHYFVLEGRALRACFGTTKYCHTWLRNMTCSNPDCLYLHDVGCQEDSFTKDEIISAYTRSRVPQIALNNLQRRSGSVLPPPADDFLLGGTASTSTLVNKSSSNAKLSPPNSTAAPGAAGRSTVLPAAASWGLRSNSRPSVPSTSSMQGSAKQKAEISSSSSSMSVSPKQSSAWHDDIYTEKTAEESWITHMDGRHRFIESCKSNGRDSRTVITDVLMDASHIKPTSAWYDDDSTTSKLPAGSYVLDGRSRTIESFKSLDRDSRAAVPDSSNEFVHAKETSAWYDDEIKTSEVFEESHAVHLSVRSGPLEPKKSCTGRDFGTAISNLSAVITYTKQASAWDDDEIISPKISEEKHSLPLSGMPKLVEVCRTHSGRDSHASVSDLSADIILDTACTSVTSTNHSSSLSSTEDRNKESLPLEKTKGSANKLHCEEYDQLSCGSASDKVNSSFTDLNGNIQTLCSDLSILNVDNHSVVSLPNGLAGTDNQRLRPSNVAAQLSYSSCTSQTLLMLDPSSSCSWNDFGSTGLSESGDSRILGGIANETLHPFKDDNIIFNEHDEKKFSSLDCMGKVLQHPSKIESVGEMKQLGILNQPSHVEKTTTVDMGESTIISNVLSMDFDPWDHSLISANNFVRLLSETNKNGSLRISNSWKMQNNNQSRFSFARQESQPALLKPSLSEIGHVQRNRSISHGSFGNGLQNGFAARSVENPLALINNRHSLVSPDRTAAVSRAKISAPPGFSVPNRATPPGFFPQDKEDQAYDTTFSESILLGNSLQRDQYQAPLTVNTGDVEFIDPAILAVGKGRLPLGLADSGLGLRSSFPPQFNTSEGDPRLQLLMQQSIPAHHGMRMSDHKGDRFLPLSDPSIPSRFPAQNYSSLSPSQMPLQPPLNPRVCNNQWGGWNDVQTGSDMGMTEILRNERLGLNKYFPGNEELMLHLPGSGDLHTRAFGM